jgi:hypothetical protein
MNHIMKLERRFERESRLLDKILTVARTGDEITLSDFDLDDQKTKPQGVHSKHGRFVVEFKEGELSPKSVEFFRKAEEDLQAGNYEAGYEWGDEEGRPYREVDLPSRYYLLSENLGSAVDCGLHDDVALVFPTVPGIFWCDWKAEGIFFSGTPNQVVTVYDGFLEASYRTYLEPTGDEHYFDEEKLGDRKVRLKKDIWQVYSHGTVYLKTLSGFTRIRTENGIPVGKTDILQDLAERQDFRIFEWGAYGNALWIHLKEGFIHVGPDGRESRINLSMVDQDHHMWRHRLKHRFWTARDDFLAFVVEGVIFVFKNGQQIARFVDLPGVPTPHAVSERGLVYSFPKVEYGDDEWTFASFDGKTTPLHLHSHLGECWIIDQRIVCLNISKRPTLLVIK